MTEIYEIPEANMSFYDDTSKHRTEEDYLRLHSGYQFLEKNFRGISKSLMIAGTLTGLAGLVTNTHLVTGTGVGITSAGIASYLTANRECEEGDK